MSNIPDHPGTCHTPGSPNFKASGNSAGMAYSVGDAREAGRIRHGRRRPHPLLESKFELAFVNPSLHGGGLDF